MSDLLRIGDTVRWRGAWGHDPERRATITAIEWVEPGQKYGDPHITAMPWAEVRVHAVVTLDNGHWAYGDQIRPEEG